MAKRKITFEWFLNRKRQALCPTSKEATDRFLQIVRRNRDFPEGGPRIPPGKTFLIVYLAEYASQMEMVTFNTYLTRQNVVLRPWQREAAEGFLNLIGPKGRNSLIADWQRLQGVVDLMRQFIRDYGNVFEV